MQDHFVPREVIGLISRLEAYGHRAYAVGGCVRDMLLCRPIHDWDLTTSAFPNEIKAVFSDLKTVDIGIKHGTVAVVLGGETYEITTYRIDGGYTDSRHPDSVTFTPSLAEDLARRDFTINAMAYHPSEGITDLFGGRQDLKNKIIRAVGDPEKRFSEDALRILRGLRFSAQLGFVPEPGTARAMNRLCHTVCHVSAERIRDEFTRLICAPGAADVLGAFANIISQATGISIIPEDLKVLSSAESRADIRLSVLLFRDEKRESILRSLKYDLATVKKVVSTVGAAQQIPTARRGELLRLLGQYSVSVCTDACAVGRLLMPEHVEAFDRADELFRLADREGLCTRVSQLALDGHDLAALGMQGREIGDGLYALLRAVTDGICENAPQALLAYIRSGSHIKKSGA